MKFVWGESALLFHPIRSASFVHIDKADNQFELSTLFLPYCTELKCEFSPTLYNRRVTHLNL